MVLWIFLWWIQSWFLSDRFGLHNLLITFVIRYRHEIPNKQINLAKKWISTIICLVIQTGHLEDSETFFNIQCPWWPLACIYNSWLWRRVRNRTKWGSRALQTLTLIRFIRKLNSCTFANCNFAYTKDKKKKPKSYAAREPHARHKYGMGGHPFISFSFSLLEILF